MPDSGTQQTMTSVRPLTAESACKPRDPCSPCACGLTHGETAPRSPCARAWHTAKSAVAVCFFVCRVFSCRHTANPLFAVCPIKCTRQRFWHTANKRFRVVVVDDTLLSYHDTLSPLSLKMAAYQQICRCGISFNTYNTTITLPLRLAL